MPNVKWNALFPSKSHGVNNFYSFFYCKFDELTNKHAPTKTISNREAKQLYKPSITKGVRVSTEVQNMLYRKEICTLTHFSEEQYYSNFFDDNVIYIRKTKKHGKK